MGVLESLKATRLFTIRGISLMDLQKISSGMDNGPEAIQKNFEAVDQAVENMGGN